MARLYANENFPFPVVQALRQLGHDVLTSRDAGQANQGIPDDDVVRFSSQDKRAVVTLNRRDFVAVHHKSAVHEGIITCTVDSDYPALAQRIHLALVDVATLAGKLIRVVKPS